MSSPRSLAALLAAAVLTALGFQSPVDARQDAAIRVLGQPDVDSASLSTRCTDPDARFMRTDFGGGFVGHGPAGVVVTSVGRLFAADFGGRRILSWADVDDLPPCQPADLVIDIDAAGERILFGPESVAVDAENNLYVADTLSHTVKIFSAANNYALSTTLGTGEPGTSPDAFHFPRGVAVADNGRLFVADDYNNRVLMFDPPFAAGESATDSLSASLNGGLAGVKAVALDGTTLFVADYGHERVLRFDGPFTTPEQIYSAAGELTGISRPVDLAVGPRNSLFVTHQAATGDQLPSSIAAYASATTRGDVTQPDADSDQGAKQPLGLAFDGRGRLYIADYLGYRLLIHDFAATPHELPAISSRFRLAGPDAVRKGARARISITQIKDAEPLRPDKVVVKLDGRRLGVVTLDPATGKARYRLPVATPGKHRVSVQSAFAAQRVLVAKLDYRVRRS